MEEQTRRANGMLGPQDRVQAACPICSGSDLRVLPFRYDFRGRLLFGVRCRSCGVSFLDPLPNDAEIEQMYREEYFTECSDTCGAHGPAAYMEVAEASTEKRIKGARRLDRLFTQQMERRGRLLEVGCGPGLLLAELRQLGWTVHGLEISEFAVQQAVAKLGLEVTRGTIEPGDLPSASFDAVFMGDVLEHLPRPLSSLQAVHGWLRPGGVLIIAIPSTLNLLSARIGMLLYRARRRFKTLRLPPYHLFEYTPHSIRATLAKSGFEVVSLRQSTVPLRRMGLRGSWFENLGKVTLQLMAALTSRLFNSGGDRLLIVAKRKT